MKPLKDFIRPEAGIKYVLTDIDDTLTSNGKLESEAYAAMWKLHDAGIRVIPVTGRPAGWCDMIIRQWPVDAVIGENGAFAYFFEDSQLKSFVHPSVADGESIKKLENIYATVKEEIPLVRRARDQFARIYDLAIDFNEDPPKLGYQTAVKIRDICEEFGAEAKISSIHVNTWFGNYSKRDTAILFMKERYGLSEDEFMEQAVFCGDSPNDEPMFGYLPISFAVANILDFRDILKNEPAFVASKRGGKGFVEIASKLI
ncbi:MAG: HAD-IIB family hydrolase [Spirochaetales bacterium]|uniref:HAD-IIB family hydrolase n=1 Tax=Candidatus Thalassospirochaeta sargassi TaxID=3119039 RepID=A0AAJ1IF43_9SPIO|nr:HAD-IIB family hydrolase [Spirochaetales bacterium]